MPTPQFTAVGQDASVNDLRDAYIGLTRYLNYLLSALDTLNISRLDAKVVKTGTLDANLVTIAADDGSGAFYKINSDGIQANNGSLDTMLFDLATGLLTVTSALIQSAAGYPQVTLNSATNLIGAYLNATNSIEILPDVFGSPLMTFDNGSVSASIGNTSTKFVIIGSLGVMRLQSNNDMEISSSGGKVKFDSWSNIYSNSQLETLQQALNDLQNQIDDLDDRVTALGG